VPEDEPTRLGQGDASPPTAGSEDRTVLLPARSQTPHDDSDTTVAGTPGLFSRLRGLNFQPQAPAVPPAVPPAAAPHTEPAGPLAEGQAFGPRYHIIRLLGIGGMGAVYQAWDAELGVAVAIKVIRPEVMADRTVAEEISRRFKRELLLARQVTHRNVVRIHDLGDIGDIKYITMPYVDGADLATILMQEGRLPVDRTLRIARPMVEGLAEAHKAGVVHRDLKPANIMIDAEDQPLIMDFGIARSTGRPASGSVPGQTTIVNDLRRALDAPADATVLGAVVGTVSYMAPEQARGQPVDQRADIYALGLIVFDMLVGGSRAERAGGAMVELQARMQAPPPPIKSFLPDMPDAFDAVVSRCLAPDPAKRYQTTAELAEALAMLDETGHRRRIARTVDSRVAAAVMTLGMATLGGAWWFTRGPVVPEKREPVSVLIADFQNLSRDPTFDGTLEPVARVALEGAEFISAYDRPNFRRSFGTRPPEKLDEQAAQEIAIKQGVNVILSGSVNRAGSAYVVSMKAMHGVTGNVIATVSGTASDKDQVLGVATRLANDIRRELGDNTSDEGQRFAMDTLSATSIEAVHDYAEGMVANSNGEFEKARDKFADAVEREPTFGMGWTALAMLSFNLDKHQDTEKYIKEAMRHLDAMTERERYRTRGLFYLATSDYNACVTEYADLVTKYSGDASARNNLALCSSRLRKNAEAAEQMREVVRILPNRALYRENLALYLAYAGDFRAAEQEARVLQEPGVFGLLAVAFAQVGQGQLPQAGETYARIGKFDGQGASYMTAGLGDMAVYEGRFSDAVKILTPAAAADVRAEEPDRAAAKFAALAYAHLSRRQHARAVAAAEQSVANSTIPKIRFLAARTFAEAGHVAKARALADSLGAELQPEPQAYARIIEGILAVRDGRARDAIKPLMDANALLDTWIGRFELGRAYFEAGAYTQADSELDRCITRRGEALSLFLDEDPTFGYLPSVYYYQGRVREELKTTGFAESFKTYLQIRGKSAEDPLLPEVRERAGQ
jgi:tetratricopeptide (TPR) repeat protein/tRNA A-37 threonylcarbamoyl transferase component Bud32